MKGIRINLRPVVFVTGYTIALVVAWMLDTRNVWVGTLTGLALGLVTYLIGTSLQERA